MNFEVEVLGLDNVKRKLNVPRWRSAMRKELTILAIELQTHVVRDKLNGQVLKNQSGTLARSINWRVDEAPEGPTAFVGSFAGYVSPSGQFAASYARLHEFGGTVTVPAHTRRVSAKADLMDMGMKAARASGFVFEQNVRAHTAVYPERSFLRSALADYKDKIQKGIRAATIQAMK